MAEIIIKDGTDPFLVFFAVAVIGMALLFRFYLLPKFDRKRITQHVESNGGKVTEILSENAFSDHGERVYLVSYITREGRKLRALCRTNMTIGVLWISNTPPDN